MVCLTEGRTARLSVSLLQRSGFGNSSCRRLLRCSLSLCFCSVSTHGLCQRLPPDPTLRSVTIGSSDLAPTQSLPISSVHGWPVWMAAADGSEVTCVAGTMAEDEVSGWVNPVTFEQLWLPQDLPLPSCRAAVGAVMKNGMPRYLFPCLETTVSSDAGRRAWHNRGLNSLPMAKTWLTFGDIALDDLRLSAYTQLLEDQVDAEVGSDEAVDAAVRSNSWKPVLPLTAVNDAVSTIFDVIANGPDALGEGFCYLIAPIDETTLPPIEVGSRLRLFLSDVDATPTSLDPEDRESWLWNRGECDLSIFSTTSGKESDFLPDVYKPLYLSG